MKISYKIQPIILEKLIEEEPPITKQDLRDWNERRHSESIHVISIVMFAIFSISLIVGVWIRSALILNISIGFLIAFVVTVRYSINFKKKCSRYLTAVKEIERIHGMQNTADMDTDHLVCLLRSSVDLPFRRMLMFEKMCLIIVFMIRERMNPLNGAEIHDESVIIFWRLVIMQYRKSRRIARVEVNAKLDAALSVIGNELDHGRRMEFFAERAKRYLKVRYPGW